MIRINTILTKVLLITLVSICVNMVNLNSAPRKVLLEEFTNASCGPCAAQNPTYEGFLEQNMDKVIPIMFHPNFPGSDVMYSNNPTMHMGRYGFYAPKNANFGVPTVFVNGKRQQKSSSQTYDGAPSDLTAISSGISASYGTQSPLSINVQSNINGQTLSTTVKVASTENMNGKVLRIAVVEGYHYYLNAGSNGEKDFTFIVRYMLPSHTGNVINLVKDVEQNFEYTQELATDLYKPSIFVVAFVQDDVTQEVLQVESNAIPNIAQLQSNPKISLTTSVTNQYSRMDANETEIRSIKVTNPNSKPVDVMLNKINDILPNGWTSTLSSDVKTIPAGGSMDFDYEISTGSNAGFATTIFEVIPTNVGLDFPIVTSASASTLSNKTKHVVYYGTNDMFNALLSSISSNTEFGGDFAFIPFNSGYLNNYSPETFDVSFFSSSLGGSSRLFSGIYVESPLVMNKILTAINAGKKVVVTSDYDLTYALSTNGTAAAKDFYSQLGIESGGNFVFRREYVNNQFTGNLYQFPITGVANDVIGNALSFTGNQYNQTSNPYYVYLTDILKAKSGSNGVPFLYMDNDQSKVGGLRFTKGESKYIYMSIGFEALNTNDRATLVDRIMKWLAEPTVAEGPKITVDNKTVAFGTVDTDKSKSMDVKITNSGDQVLNVTSIIIQDPKGAYTLVNGNSIKTIEPGADALLTIKFAPESGDTYNASVVITTDAKNESTTTLTLSGKGNPAGNVAYGTTPNGKLSMTMTPNPVVDMSQFNYTVNSENSFVKIYVMDLSGKIVAELVNSNVSNGTYNLEFSAANYSSGTYFIMAEIDGSQAQIPVVIAK